MKKNLFAGRIKNILVSLIVLCGLCLIIGATNGLPTSAQGLVTGRSDILIDRLVEQVGAQELTLAVTDAGIIDARPRQDRNDGRRGRNRDGRIRRNLDGALDDQLERIGPEIVYQIAVDADLLTRAEANRLLEE